MCFSTTVSFTAGAVLLTISSYTIYTALTRNKKYLLFACMPLFFGIQQILEGFVWLGLLESNPLFLKIASLGFIFFALFFWPIFSPLSVYLIEGKESKRKKILLILLGLGLVAGVAMYLPIIMSATPLDAKIHCGSIRYNWIIPQPIESIYSLVYLLVTVVPFLITSNIKMKIFAIFVLISLAISSYFYMGSRTSVWCFFAAILSIFVAYVIHKLPKK